MEQNGGGGGGEKGQNFKPWWLGDCKTNQN